MSTISQNTIRKYYFERTFLQIFKKSMSKEIETIITILYLSFTITFVIILCTQETLTIIKNKNILDFINIVITFSITVFGFLLISFSILVNFVISKNIPSFFLASLNKENGSEDPKLKSILTEFILPVGLYFFLFLVSLIIRLVLLYLSEDGNASILMIVVSSFIVSHFLLSIIELANYIYNIYATLVLMAYTSTLEVELSVGYKIENGKNEFSDIENYVKQFIEESLKN